MAVCRACGAAVGREFRFCAQCAAPVGPEVELVDYGVPVQSEAAVRRTGPDRRWALAAGGLVLVLLALWGLGDLSGGGSAGGGAPTTSPPGATATTALATPGGDAGSGGDPSTTGRAIVGPGPSGDYGPVLDRPANLSLLVGSTDSLASIDLDSGVVTAYRRGGYPVIASGGWLVVERAGGDLRSVPLSDPDSRGSQIPGGPLLAAARGPVDGQAWLLTGEPPAWWLVNLSDGALAAPPRPGVVPPSLASTVGPAVTGSRAGGVFAEEGDGYRRVFDGLLLGASDRYVVAETCEGPNRCRLHWLDRTSWAEVIRPLPADAAVSSGDAGVWLSPDGRFLVYPAGDNQVRLFDAERGATLPVAPVPGSVSAAPDSSLLALLDGGSLLVYETATGQTHPVLLDADAPPRQARTLLVPRSQG